jgi:UDP-glucuronate 4-epimerase
MAFIGAMESAIGREATKHFLPMQEGDVPATFADTSELAALVGFAPGTPLTEGVQRFVSWYRAFYRR